MNFYFTGIDCYRVNPKWAVFFPNCSHIRPTSSYNCSQLPAVNGCTRFSRVRLTSGFNFYENQFMSGVIPHHYIYLVATNAHVLSDECVTLRNEEVNSPIFTYTT